MKSLKSKGKSFPRQKIVCGRNGCPPKLIFREQREILKSGHSLLSSSHTTPSLHFPNVKPKLQRFITEHEVRKEAPENFFLKSMYCHIEDIEEHSIHYLMHLKHLYPTFHRTCPTSKRLRNILRCTKILYENKKLHDKIKEMILLHQNVL